MLSPALDYSGGCPSTLASSDFQIYHRRYHLTLGVLKWALEMKGALGEVLSMLVNLLELLLKVLLHPPIEDLYLSISRMGGPHHIGIWNRAQVSCPC